MPPISFFIEFQIRKESCNIQEWLAEFAKRAAAAERDEPGTLAYAALVNDKDATNINKALDSDVIIFFIIYSSITFFIYIILTAKNMKGKVKSLIYSGLI